MSSSTNSEQHRSGGEKEINIVGEQVVDTYTKANRKHVCGVCNQDFETSGELHLHLIGYVYEFRCEICFRVFDVKAALDKHNVMHHSQKQAINVEALDPGMVKSSDHSSGDGPSSDTNVSKEIEMLLDPSGVSDSGAKVKDKFVCDICEEDFLSQDLLHFHKQIHVGGDCPYQCPICSIILANEMAMLSHVKTHSQGVYHRICPFCREEFANAESFENHQCLNVDTPQMVVNFVEKFVTRKKEKEEDDLLKAESAGSSGERRQNDNSYQGMPLMEVSSHVNKDEHEKVPTNSNTKEKSVFVCSDCGLKFRYSFFYRKHQKTHGTATGDGYNCAVCSHSFDSKVALQDHVKSHRIEDKIHKCPVCSRQYKNWNIMLLHIKRSHGKKALREFRSTKRPENLVSASESVESDKKSRECSICHKVLSSAKAMPRHLKYHSREKQHECTICGRMLSSFQNLLNHTEKKHGKSDTTGLQNDDLTSRPLVSRPLKPKPSNFVVLVNRPPMTPAQTINSPNIGLSSPNIVLSTPNIGSSTPNIGLSAPNIGFIKQQTLPSITDKKSKEKHRISKRILVNHMKTSRTSAKKVQYTCNHCNKTFSRLYVFRNHLRVLHSKVLQKSVDQTPKFHFKSGIGNKRLFRCPTCGFIYIHGYELKTHLRIHSKDLPYECKICLANFDHKEKYDEHILQHPKLKLPKKKPIHFCSICKKGFAKKSDVKRHLVVHTRVRAFQCEICGMGFNRKDAVTAHVRRVHVCVE